MMTRPKIRRYLRFNPRVKYFKPRGIPLKLLEEEVIKADELEAIKLHDVDNLEHKKAAEKMGVSQPTFSRILNGGYKKMAKALIKGRAIRLDKEDY